MNDSGRPAPAWSSAHPWVSGQQFEVLAELSRVLALLASPPTNGQPLTDVRGRAMKAVVKCVYRFFVKTSRVAECLVGLESASLAPHLPTWKRPPLYPDRRDIPLCVAE